MGLVNRRHTNPPAFAGDFVWQLTEVPVAHLVSYRRTAFADMNYLPKPASIQAPHSRGPLTHIPVFYTAAMVADAGSFSPSTAKPAAVVNSWKMLGLPLKVIEPHPVTSDEIARAHDPVLVDGVLARRLHIGFGNCSMQSVAVGTGIAPRPPHRSVRAALPHTAPALSHDAKRSLGYG